ncbi:MAG TPA: SRPBCC family protein [Acidimicrobiia bacterium]|nr:SRPBCC family protein [Acidimicrobiia bacterium]
MPSQTFSHSATAKTSVQAVWAALDRPGTWETIGGVDRVFEPVIDEAGRLRGFSFEAVAGGRRYLGSAAPWDRVEGEVIAWRIESSEVRGGIRVETAVAEGGTRIEVTLEIESTGVLSSIFFPVIAGAIGSGLPNAVENFAAGLSTPT